MSSPKSSGVWGLQDVRDKYLQGQWNYASNPSERTKLYVWGANADGKLGLNQQGPWSPDGTYLTARSSPTQLPGDYSAVAFGAGQCYTIKTDGTLWVTGKNNDGALGMNNAVSTTYSSPTQIGTGTDWARVVTTYSAVNAVKTNGTLWGWGQNTSGQIGRTARDKFSSPTQIGTDTDWSSPSKHISGAYYHVNAIRPTAYGPSAVGGLWFWGNHGYGTSGLNLGQTGGRSSPTQVGTLDKWLVCDSGTYTSYAIHWDWNGNGDKTLWSWGWGGQGRLGLNNQTARSSPTQIGTGTDWSLVKGGAGMGFAINDSGELWAWGSNQGGKLGLNDVVFRSSPTQIPGTTWSWIDCSHSTVFASKTDSSLWSWGYNASGQNGVNDNFAYPGSSNGRSSPIQIPGYWNLEALELAPIPSRAGAALKA